MMSSTDCISTDLKGVQEKIMNNLLMLSQTTLPSSATFYFSGVGDYRAKNDDPGSARLVFADGCLSYRNMFIHIISCWAEL
jgi:hypothetical protein